MELIPGKPVPLGLQVVTAIGYARQIAAGGILTAKCHSSFLFIDEMDGLLPRGDNGYYMGQHQIQFVEQGLVLMSQLDPGNQVFLIGTTNHSDNIDPRVLRGGRFTEKIDVGVPETKGICS
jgi:cell division protease FtsH